MSSENLVVRLARSLTAVVVLAALVVGVPAALAAIVGWPLPRTIPRLGDITSALGRQSIDDVFLVKALAVVCWLAWAQFAACVGAEILGWRRGRGARRVPLAGALQPLVAQLVMAAALLVHLVPRPSAAAPVVLTATPAVQLEAVPTGTAVAAATAGPEPALTSEKPRYVVKARDDLWSLAETHLGKGSRWRELFDLNQGRPQTDGSALRRPNLIRPGWVLRFPPDAVGLTESDAAPPIAASLPPPAGASAELPQVATSRTAPTVATCPDPAAEEGIPAPATGPEPPPATGHIAPDPPAMTDMPVTAVPSAPEPEPSSPQETEDPGGTDVPVGILGAGLLAAGVVTTLDRLRRAQQRRRPPHRAVRMPAATVAPTEVAVRRSAASSPAGRLDLALRAFAVRATTRRNGAVPSVSAVQVGPGAIEILLGAPLDAESGPFTMSGDGQVWTLPATVPDATLHDSASDVGAPLPALASVGALGDSTVLVDVEATGCTALTGDPETARRAFRTMALELATSAWADTLEVIIVSPDIEAFRALERVRVASTLSDVLSDIGAAAGALNDALVAATAPTTLAARMGDSAADGWVPTVVLCADPGADPDAFAHLQALAGAGGRGLAVIAVGEVADVGRIVRFVDGKVEVTPPGVTLAMTGPTAEQAADVEEILVVAADCDGMEPEADDRVIGEPRAVVAADLAVSVPSSENDFDVLVRVLGPVDIEGGKEPIDRRKAIELVVYLATHPKGLDDQGLKTALWPDDRAPQASFNTTVTKARSRLGAGADGHPHLPHLVATGGVYRVGPRVITDFHLLERHLVAARAATPEAGVSTLRAGLALVRGLPFAGARQGYEWAYAEGLVARMETVVGEAAHHLAHLALEGRDPDLAQWAACQGILASPGDEVLYRDRMLACDLAGNPAGVEAVMDELVAAVEALEPYDTLHPETLALYERLSHRRRRTG